MKFVGSIKGKHFLIDPETYEAEIREKIANRLVQECLPVNSIHWNQAMTFAIKIVKGEVE